MKHYILLDASGSMDSIWTESLGGINLYVSNTKKSDTITVVAFDSSRYEVLRDSVKVSKYVNIEPNEISPIGMTPLYDAAGRIVDTMFKDNPKRAALTIVTDGAENSSKEYNNESIKAKLKRVEDKNWDVVFIGANFDTDHQAARLGFGVNKTLNTTTGNIGAAFTVAAASRAVYGVTGQSSSYGTVEKIAAAGNVAANPNNQSRV